MRVLPRLRIDKIIFQYITMPFCAELKTVLELSIAVFVGGVFGMVVQRIFEYDEEIEELYSRLEDCEKNISETENYELKK